MAYTTIDKGSKYFDVKLRQGFGSSGGTVTGLSFKPEMFWEKNRTSTTGSGTYVYDVVRGVYKFIRTNLTDAEASNTNLMTSFNSDGFTLGSADYATDQSLVAWCWSAGNSTGVSNTDGTITTTVSANTTSGFSIFTYTGTGSNATLGHGLGVAPKVVFIKCRSADNDWRMYHASLPTDYVIYLNSTYQKDLNNTVYNGAPTSTTIGIKTNTTNNGSGSTYVGYAFAEVKGYSKFSSYVGNGSTDGTFIYTGMRPAFIIVKRTDTTGTWFMFDNKRDTYNFLQRRISPNETSAEGVSGEQDFDFLSNGFKPRRNAGDWNASGGTYIYMAFAENPFVSSKGVPVCAR